MLKSINLRTLLKYLIVFALAFALLLFLVQLGLKIYTHHGQKIEMQDWVGQHISDAEILAKNSKSQIVINDSVFVVGKKGGLILDQNPKPGSFVKQNRKVYVTVTKYGIETLQLKNLPVLYGNSFEQKKKELEFRDIELVIKDYLYDSGEPNHILAVYYNGNLVISKDEVKKETEIKRGGVLECVVSKRDGGEVTIPNLLCLELEEAKFLLESSKLTLGSVVVRGSIEDGEPQYILNQSPPYDGITNIKMGESITVTVGPNRPVSCE